MSERDRGVGGPPPLWERLLRWLLPREQREAALGDAAEEMARRARADGVREARRWYRRQALRSLPSGLGHRLAWRGRERRTSAEGAGTMELWRTDLRLAMRTLWRRPAFTATVVGTLAMGVAATTALFGVFKSVFLEPIDLPDSDELVVVMGAIGTGCCGPAAGPDYLDWIERNRSFDAMAALSPGRMTLSGIEQPEQVYATRVTASAFDLLGVPPMLGRALVADDQVAPAVAVLSHGTWERLFAADPDVLGTTLVVNGDRLTVVGVMPAGFDVPSPWARTVQHQLYVPFANDALDGSRSSLAFPVIARLSEGTSVADAGADMERVMRELALEYPATNANRTARVFTVHDYLFGDVGRQLGLLLAAAALVLLIAAGNVAGLQLARAVGREPELAVRSALGASRAGLLRLLLTESFAIAAVGGALGILLSFAAADGVAALLPATVPRADAVDVDGTAVLFGLGSSAVAALLFGTLPAFLVSRGHLAARVKEGGYATLAPRKERVRDAFIVVQVAAGLVLANGAMLLARSYSALTSQEYGFESEGVVTLSLNPAGPEYEELDARQRYIEEVLRSVSEVPGVAQVGTISRLPLEGGTNGRVQVEGWPERTNENEGPLVEVTSVVGGYFDVMGIPLLRGRLLEPGDSAADVRGVVVNEAMVEEVWPGEDPIGKRFAHGTPPPWLTVVGVVGDTRQQGPERPPSAQVFMPFAIGWASGGFLTVRIDGDFGAVVPAVRDAVLSVDRALPPTDVTAMDDRLARWFAQRRFYTTLVVLFAASALMLAAAGIYGTVSYYVARRVRELGVRMALGAGGTGILSLVLGRGLRLALIGIAVGLAGVFSSARVLDALVYGVASSDVLALVLGGLLLTAVTVGASAVPAIRAVRVSPVDALRSE